LRLSRLAVRSATDNAMGADLRRVLDRRHTANRIAHSVVPRNPLLAARGTTLLAHPPSSASLQADSSAHKLEVSFGILDGAWKDGAATDGACFRLSLAGSDGSKVQLHERCLRPVEHKEDRGEQRVALPLTIAERGTLIFETDCGGNCSWDWAYWKDIEVMH
jgi:hypothetical protein